MDPLQRFSLLEVADVTGISAKTLKARFYKLRRAGQISPGASIAALTYEDVKTLVRIHNRAPNQKNRPQARDLLRRQLTTDGMI